MKKLHEQVANIQSRDDLVAFVKLLQSDLRMHPENWENATLDLFLGALASWIEDMDGYYQNRGLDVPQRPAWKTFAEMLAAARIYE